MSANDRIDYAADLRVMPVPQRAMWLFSTCSDEFKVSISVYVHNEVWYTRLSAQVYNDLSDFEYAGKVLREVCQRVSRVD